VGCNSCKQLSLLSLVCSHVSYASKLLTKPLSSQLIKTTCSRIGQVPKMSPKETAGSNFLQAECHPTNTVKGFTVNPWIQAWPCIQASPRLQARGLTYCTNRSWASNTSRGFKSRLNWWVYFLNICVLSIEQHIWSLGLTCCLPSVMFAVITYKQGLK